MSKVQPRAWSMEAMRKQGYLTGTTEHWNHHVQRRQDLFGFIDFIAVGHRRCVAVQCCSRSGLATHRTKILNDCSEAATEWLLAGNAIELHGWDRIKEPLKTKDGHRIRRRCKVIPLVDTDLGIE